MSSGATLREPFYRDVVRFVVLLVALSAVTAVFTEQVLRPVFEAEGLIHAAWEGAASLFGEEHTLQAGLAGVWLGVVVLWAADTYKRTLVLAPVALGAVCAWAVGGSGLLSVVAAPDRVVVLLTFCLGTAQLGGIGVVQRARGGRLIPGPPNEPVELRKGPQLLFVGACLVVLAGVVDHHLTLTMADAPTANPTFWNAAAGAAVAGLLYPFVRYDNRRRVVQIGPGRSGKTSNVGGMYCDVKAGSRAPSESRSGRQLVGNQLRGISDRLANSRVFPNRTQKTGNIPFDYFDSRRLFRRKNVIMTFDYEGQRLTGENGPEESFAAKLETYRNRRDDAGALSGLRSRVRRILGLDTDPWYAEFARSATEPDIAKLLDSADTVVFTLPMDDFLTPTFERQGRVPDDAGLYLLEPTGDDEERYTVRRPWGETFEVSRSTDGRIVRASDGMGVPGIDFDEFEALPRAPTGGDGERRYTTDEPRAPVSSYLEEYQHLVDLLWESGSRGWFDASREFVWVATMSDLVYDDFVGLYQDLLPRNVDDGNGSRTLEYLRENGLFDGSDPANDPQDYTLFGQWIVEECVQKHVMRAREWSELDDGQSLPDVDEMIERTGERNVYPVWFDVARSGEELVIEDGDGRLLKGSNFLFDRLEGRPLPYPTNERFKPSRLRVAYQRLNPFVEPTGKPFYRSAVEVLQRQANRRDQE